jgi:hypothetical protein
VPLRVRSFPLLGFALPQKSDRNLTWSGTAINQKLTRV